MANTLAQSALPPVALATPMGDYVVTNLSKNYSLWKSWDAADAAKIAAGECKARVLLTSGSHPLSIALVDQLPALEYVVAMGSGIEGVDVAALRERKLKFSNAGNLTGNDVSDMAIGLMFCLTRNILGGDRYIRSGVWKHPGPPMRHSIRALRMGIAGMGAIGSEVARKLAPFGCSIAWTGRTRRPEIPYPYYPDVPALAENCDVLFVCLRADQSNRKMIGAGIFDKLGPEGYIINVSRGTIMDEDALIAALRAGRLGGAGLDVFDPEPTSAERWVNVPNAVLTPHAGGITHENIRGVNDNLINNIRRFFAGEPLFGQIL